LQNVLPKQLVSDYSMYFRMCTLEKVTSNVIILVMLSMFLHLFLIDLHGEYSAIPLFLFESEILAMHSNFNAFIQHLTTDPVYDAVLHYCRDYLYKKLSGLEDEDGNSVTGFMPGQLKPLGVFWKLFDAPKNYNILILSEANRAILRSIRLHAYLNEDQYMTVKSEAESKMKPFDSTLYLLLPETPTFAKKYAKPIGDAYTLFEFYVNRYMNHVGQEN
jgi:hypothetical protein